MKINVKKAAVILGAVALTFGFMSCSVDIADDNDNSNSSSVSTEKPVFTSVNKHSEDLTVDGTVYAKTGLVEVVAKDTTAEINMTDDSSWSSYVPESANKRLRGVFVKDRNVTLSAFSMGQYEVTQELYCAIMGNNPSEFQGTSTVESNVVQAGVGAIVVISASDSSINHSGVAAGENQALRPVERVNHYEAVAFCNELTKKVMGESNVVYFSDEAKTAAYTKEDAANQVTPYMDIEKTGYRLPTEAEWEFAARGADPQSKSWKNAFGKLTLKKYDSIYMEGKEFVYYDENLETLGWYAFNSSHKTHEVGMKEQNNAGLYDMQGNVSEWCWDGFDTTFDAGSVNNPAGADGAICRAWRGGNHSFQAYQDVVSARQSDEPQHRAANLGFRLCCSVR